MMPISDNVKLELVFCEGNRSGDVENYNVPLDQFDLTLKPNSLRDDIAIVCESICQEHRANYFIAEYTMMQRDGKYEIQNKTTITRKSETVRLISKCRYARA